MPLCSYQGEGPLSDPDDPVFSKEVKSPFMLNSPTIPELQIKLTAEDYRSKY